VDLSALFLSNTSETYDRLLKDDNWQGCTFYDLSTDSVFWNRAVLISLRKEFAITAPVALLYLLQKEAKTLTLWQQQWDNHVPTTKEFIKSVIAGGRFSNIKGEIISIESFWKEFKGTMDGVTAEPNFQFSINGVVTPYNEVLHQKDIQSVICFDNTWQEQNYFIETANEWILYHWATAA
jgi:hypothetical protein